ncbi:MAG: hypothetical protein ACREB2_02375 [Pseudolabrys sp.]
MTERPTRPTTNFTATAALCLSLGGVLLASSLPARAGDDDVPIDTKILRSILSGIGLQRDGDSNGINYRERAPLVLPPSSTLPPPENSRAALNNPAWPKDPEIAARKAAAEQERENGYNSSERIDADSRPLRPDQLAPGGNARADKRRNPVTDSATIGERLSPAELGTKKGLFSNIFSKTDEAVRFTGEKARVTLTEPPPGYQTPSPEQPYGGSGKAEPPKATDYLIEHVPHN